MRLSVILLAMVSLAAGAAQVEVEFESHPEWVRLRQEAIRIGRTKMLEVDGWEPVMSAAARSDVIWQWDSCFMALYAGYTEDGLHGLGNLDNLYRLQSPNGYMGMAYEYKTRRHKWGERINPPLFAWVEYLYARRTGDKSRLERAYDHCSRLFKWIKYCRRRANGLYWFEDPGSSGMDNSPRGGYPARDLAGSDICHVDLACQQALSARYLAKIGEVLGKSAEEIAQWKREAAQIDDLVNRHHWCDKSQFYHDVFNNRGNNRPYNWLGHKTAAAFWAIVSGVADDAKVKALVEHLENPATFGTECPVPALSRDDLNYQSNGAYWNGGVWPPIEYMVCAGLRDRGYRALAASIAKKHLAQQTAVLDDPKFGSIYEVYGPETNEPCRREDGNRGYVKKNFVGWGAVGPFLLLMEDALGLDINAFERRIDWYPTEKGHQGVSGLVFNGGTVAVSCSIDDSGDAVDAKTDGTVPFTLVIHSPSGKVVRLEQP